MTNNDTNPDQHAVVVGVDGSPSALHAVRWAAHEAERRAVSLRLVHITHVEPVRHPRQIAMPPEYRDAITEQGRHFLDEAMQVARQAVPDLAVVTDLHAGPVISSMVNESKDAALMVLGSRGLGGFASLLLGSVAVALAAHAPCPVVVMHAPTKDGAPPTDGPVVVGVDGTELSDGALAFAYQAAAARNVPVLAVHTYDVEVVGSWVAQLASLDWEQLQTEEEKRFAERIGPWREKFPQVETRILVMRGRPADALVAQGAQLVVVGSRGRGTLAGLGLGSVSQSVLHHTKCPVAVVRTV